MKLVVGNFKMNLLKKDITKYINEMKKHDFKKVVFCPSNIYLNEFINNDLVVGAQDVSFKDIGAYTGDVSASQLSSLGVKYAIIGHSERRKYYNDGIFVNQKLKLCLANKLIPILCIGESLKEKENKKTNTVLKKYLDEAFKEILPDNIIIAYEPLWSIGTGKIPSNEDIYNTTEFIKQYIYDKYRVKLKVLYGGSVNAKNINTLADIDNIDGFLIGGASIKIDEFLDIIKVLR